MSQSIEIEYKNMLTKQEYEQLLQQLPYQKSSIHQKNHYFDTASLKLQQQRSALRIRETNNQLKLTFKEPAQVGSLETNVTIDEVTMKQWLNNQATHSQLIDDRLQLKNTNLSELTYFGFLKTIRTLYKVNADIVIALDHSFYHNQVDYELEVEGRTDEQTKGFFQSLLNDFAIPKRYTKPKIRRFFDSF